MCDKGTCRAQCYAGKTGTPMGETGAPKSLEELGARLGKHYSGDAKDLDVAAVKRLMESYLSNCNDWRKFVFFDKHSYTRNLVDGGNGNFNLIVLCWGEGQGSSIHSHSNSHCFMKMLDGTLKEQRFQRPAPGTETSMEVLEEFHHSRDEVAYINDDIGLHRVENPSNVEGAVSLHLYSPPLLECDCFDQRTGHTHKGTMTFYSKFGVPASEAKGQ